MPGVIEPQRQILMSYKMLNFGMCLLAFCILSRNNHEYFCPVIEEKGVKMKLTVIDTPGFGDQINNKDW